MHSAPVSQSAAGWLRPRLPRSHCSACTTGCSARRLLFCRAAGPAHVPVGHMCVPALAAGVASALLHERDPVVRVRGTLALTARHALPTGWHAQAAATASMCVALCSRPGGPANRQQARGVARSPRHAPCLAGCPLAAYNSFQCAHRYICVCPGRPLDTSCHLGECWRCAGSLVLSAELSAVRCWAALRCCWNTPARVWLAH